jgi:2-desacetyl-2-hydroxyethyl bacteriochlorophyllide A dehydrogenase
MLALWLEDAALGLRAGVPQPLPNGPDEALVRIRLAGICGTDLALLAGYYPYAGIPGHEFVGEVVAAADGAWIGQRVVGEINLGCGDCEECCRLGPKHCRHRKAVGITGHAGAFAEYLTLPLANLHRVPDTVSDAAAVFTEPLAAALAIQQGIRVAPDQRVLLIGAGRLGQLIAQTLSLTGCDLSVVVRHPLQRRLLEDRGIACYAEEGLPDGRFSTVVEASGSPTGFELARTRVRPGGTIILKSTYPGRVPVDLSSLVVDEIRLVGSRCGPFDAALRLLAQGHVDPVPLISRVYPLSEALEAFAAARAPHHLKILLTPPGRPIDLQG